MVLLLGICKALKALHQYRVERTGGRAEVAAAKKVRKQAVRADQEAEQEVEAAEANSSRRRRDKMRAMADTGDTEQEPLMDDEVTASQDGVQAGEIRAYAHRDIKPGESPARLTTTSADAHRQHHDSRRRPLPHSNGHGLPRSIPNPNNFALPRSRRPGPCRRALHHALSRARTVRRQD